jgi:pimeloyl-ACP methyl ester carboxylesterase
MGYGGSAANSLPRTPENIATELDALLSALGISEGILLMGHSQGGLYAVSVKLPVTRSRA